MFRVTTVVLICLWSISLARGQEAEISPSAPEFFTDLGVLEKWDKGAFDLGWVHPDVAEYARRYDSVMIDQPEIFLSPDSKYKGAKADDIKSLSDAARATVVERIEAGGWAAVDEPGPNVLYIRWALVDMELRKKKRGLLSYTPVGLVAHAGAQAAIQDVWKKVRVDDVGLNIEWIDSTSGDLLSAGHARRGADDGKKTKIVSWEELYALFATIGEQTRCHLDTVRALDAEADADLALVAEMADCDAIVVEPETD